MKEKS